MAIGCKDVSVFHDLEACTKSLVVFNFTFNPMPDRAELSVDAEKDDRVDPEQCKSS